MPFAVLQNEQISTRKMMMQILGLFCCKGADWIIAIICGNSKRCAAPKAAYGHHSLMYTVIFRRSRASWIHLRHSGGFLFARINVSCRHSGSRENGINSSNTPQTEGNGFLYFACRCCAVDFWSSGAARAGERALQLTTASPGGATLWLTDVFSLLSGQLWSFWRAPC